MSSLATVKGQWHIKEIMTILVVCLETLDFFFLSYWLVGGGSDGKESVINAGDLGSILQCFPINP